jgi:hypothetical protein
VTEALDLRDQALDLAERYGDPHGLAYALWFTIFLAVEGGDLERVAEQTARMKEITAHHRLRYMDTVAEGFGGYLRASRDDARAGIARMRATIADPHWRDMDYVLRLQTLYLLARAAAAAGDLVSARATVDEAISYAGPGPSIWKPSFAYLTARLAGLGDRTGASAVPAFRRALGVARRFGSAWAELSVAVELGRWSLERGCESGWARRELDQALGPYADAPPRAAVAAGRILFDRLDAETPE